ncbi:MAG: glycosyltransferase [bacterium]|nr:glycosyltransferase [bacterium]
MKVSIITPYYNGRHFIEDAVNSVLMQTYEDFEMIIVNDASPDMPMEFLGQLAGRDKRIKLLNHEKNRGISAARNTAIMQAEGDCIALLDQDDLWLPDKLQLQIDYLKDHRERGLVFCNYYRIDKVGKITGQGKKCKTVVGTSLESTLINLFMKNRITACSVMFRRECLDAVGLFDESLIGGTDDYDMWLRIAGQYQIGYIDEPLVKRRSHGENTSTKFKERGMLDHLSIIEGIAEKFPILKKYKSERLSKIYYNLGRYYIKRGSRSESIRNFRDCIRCTPLKLKAYLYLAQAFVK